MTTVPLNMNPTTFWDLYLKDDAQFWMGRFYEVRGEKKIEDGTWEDATTPE